MATATGRYDGPVCYVCQNEYRPRRKLLGGGLKQIWVQGWHYSTKPVTVKVPALKNPEHPELGFKLVKEQREVPDQRLHLNDSDPDEKNWFYELATDEHKSWLEKHGAGNIVQLETV